MLDRGQARRASECYTEFCDPPKSVTPGGAVAHFLQHAWVWSVDRHHARGSRTEIWAKLNVCIVIDHSEWVHLFWTCWAAEAKRLISITRAQRASRVDSVEHWVHDTDKRMIWDMRIKVRLLSGASSRGTLRCHWATGRWTEGLLPTIHAAWAE